MHPTSLCQKYRTPKNEQHGQRLNEIQALSVVEDSNGGEGVGRKKKKQTKRSTQCLAILREIFNNNNNNTYSLNKFGPNMKI